MNGADFQREIAVWVGGTFALLGVLAVAYVLRNKTAPPETGGAEKGEGQIALRIGAATFAATFVMIALMADIAPLLSPSFSIPRSAKYVMALCASVPAYLLRRRK